MDDWNEDFSWFDVENDDNYFCLSTKFKNNFQKDRQIYHCYGRRTNRHLLNVYGFVLENNKYNSLQFMVILDFNKGQEEKKKEEG